MTEGNKVPLNQFKRSGFLDGVEATITNARFVFFAFPTAGKQACLEVTFVPKQEIRNLRPQMYKVGDPASFVPSENGDELISPTGAQIHENTKFGVFITSLYDAGFDGELKTISEINDLKVRLKSVPNSQIWGGSGNTQMSKGNTILIDEILGDDSAPTKGGGEVSKVEDVAKLTILEILEASGKPMKKSHVVLKANKAEFASPAERNLVLDLVGSDEFLASSDEWKFENGILSLEE